VKRRKKRERRRKKQAKRKGRWVNEPLYLQTRLRH
jgi:hypothetical protein